ncbi:unnamed protein product [Triticum turgidum subsp. durum]|uniref:GRF-type domain-containing protein n=1 Tax=Triticum turgidum subsp. durum TaxID=4567 RepID=A0A9R1B5U9_TRITD|nr:unnamed protein product [Triticum turgidum subsp. durum]
MCSSASRSSSTPPTSHHTSNQMPPLPLIRCPECNAGYVVWFVSGTELNPGRHFYKCERNGHGGCRFWKWENKYIQYLSERWGHLISHASVHRHVALLEQNQAFLKKIFMLCLANLVVMVTISIHKL